MTDWKQKIEAQIAELRAAYCTEDADAMQALLDVAVAADETNSVALAAALDKLREVGDDNIL